MEIRGYQYHNSKHHNVVAYCPACEQIEIFTDGDPKYADHIGGTETPTCTTGKTCEKCGGKYGALGHDWGEWKPGESGTHIRTCQRSGCSATDTGSCSGGNATCVTAGTCATCGGSYYGGHTFSKTWSSDDSSHWKPCIYCDQAKGSEEGHYLVESMNSDPRYLKSEANCVSRAVYYKSCAFCGYISKTETFIDKWGSTNPNNHDLVHRDAKAPTCTEAGYTAHDACQREGCGYTTDHTELPALNHDFSIWQSDNINHWKKCSRCDATDAVNPHEWDNGKITVPPTCTTAGERIYTCTECSKTKTEEISATGHNFIHHEAKAPTCTEIGWNAYDTCKNCDYTTYAEIKALDHDLVHHDAQAATCTEIGWNAYDTCSRCDYTTYAEIPATGHDFTEKVVAPTCEAGGYTKYTCKNCDYSYTDHPTQKLLHWFAEWTSNGDGTHSAPCKREDCDHIGKAECASIEYTQNAGTADAKALSICPVCGDVSDGAHLALIDTAKAAGKHLPTGELTVRMGDTANGDKLMTVAFEYAGKLTQPEGEVEITLPAELLTDYTLSIVNADGTETDLPCTTNDTTAAFTLDFTKPETTEERPAAHLIHLIPKAA